MNDMLSKESRLHSISIDDDTTTTEVTTTTVENKEVILNENIVAQDINDLIRENSTKLKSTVNNLNNTTKNKLIIGLLGASLILLIILIIK